MEIMAFRALERSEAIIDNARAEEKALEEASNGENGREEIKRGGGIGIKKIGQEKAAKEIFENSNEKKVIVKDDDVKE